MSPIYNISAGCNCPPSKECYYYACIKGNDSNFVGWTINGVPLNASSIATAYGGGGYVYTSADIPVIPPPTPGVLNALGWYMASPGDPAPVVVIKDDVGNIVNAPIKECCELTCWQVLIPKTSARLNAVTMHPCQLEFVSLAIQTDPVGTQSALQLMLDSLYPPGASVTITATGAGKIITLKNIYACTIKPEFIDDNINVFQANQIPC